MFASQQQTALAVVVGGARNLRFIILQFLNKAERVNVL